MRRHEFEQFMPNHPLGLIADCVYYAWQHCEITDEESLELDCYISRLYEHKDKINELLN